MRAKAVIIISKEVHNYVVFATRLNSTNGPFYINVVELIVLNNAKLDPLITPFKSFLTTYDRFYLSKLMGQYIMRVP